jgi:prepilin-type processing-associated H-X9-DG protein
MGTADVDGNNMPASYAVMATQGKPTVINPGNQGKVVTMMIIAGPKIYPGTRGLWAWTSGEMHQRAGNIGMCDGSVQQTTTSGLQTQILNSTNVVTQQLLNFPL